MAERVPFPKSVRTSTYSMRRSAARGVALCQGVLGYLLFVAVVSVGSSFPDFVAQRDVRPALTYVAVMVAVALHAALLIQAVVIRRTAAWRLLSYTVVGSLLLDLGVGAAGFSTGESAGAFLVFSVIFGLLPLIYLALGPWRLQTP